MCVFFMSVSSTASHPLQLNYKMDASLKGLNLTRKIYFANLSKVKGRFLTSMERKEGGI